MIVKICEKAQFTRATPGSSLAKNKEACPCGLQYTRSPLVKHTAFVLFQELLEKCNDPEVLEKCPDIRWHFIGHLQSNKATKFAKGMKNVSCIETISSAKTADKLQSAMAREKPPITVDVLIQVKQFQHHCHCRSEGAESYVKI